MRTDKIEDMSKTRRYITRNAQLGQDANLRKLAEPWKVIDTTTGSIVDEYKSGNAARMAASFYNKHGLPPTA